MNYIVYDMEWNQACGRPMVSNNTVITGEIIQIGAIKLNEELDEIDSFSVVIKPQYYSKMNPDVINLTHLSQEAVDNGISFPEAAEAFRAWCGDDFAFMTWGPTDTEELYNNLRLYGLDNTWIPATYDLQKLFDLQIAHENRQCALLYALNLLGEEAYDAHDALNDAENTVTVLWNLDMEDGLENCLTGFGGINGTFVRKDCFASLYSSVENIISDWAVKAFISPVTGLKTICCEWSAEEDGTYSSTASDKTGAGFHITLNIKRNREGKFKATRTIYRLPDAMPA